MFFNKSCKWEQPKEGYGIKSQNYAVIWSQKFISSQSKLRFNQKSHLTKVVNVTNLRKDM